MRGRVVTYAGHTTLYRLFAYDGELLYVGITNSIIHRLDQHSVDKPWWGMVTRYTEEQYSNRFEARAAEILAIQTESPAFNIEDRVPGDRPRFDVHGVKWRNSRAGRVDGSRFEWRRGELVHVAESLDALLGEWQKRYEEAA